MQNWWPMARFHRETKQKKQCLWQRRTHRQTESTTKNITLLARRGDQQFSVQFCAFSTGWLVWLVIRLSSASQRYLLAAKRTRNKPCLDVRKISTDKMHRIQHLLMAILWAWTHNKSLLWGSSTVEGYNPQVRQWWSQTMTIDNQRQIDEICPTMSNEFNCSEGTVHLAGNCTVGPVYTICPRRV